MRFPIVLCVIVWVFPIASHCEDIPLYRCCSESEIYDLGNNNCIADQPKSVPVNEWPSIDSHSLLVDHFNVSTRFVQCTKGFIAQSTIHFGSISDNGTLLIEHSKEEIKAGQFCIENVSTRPSTVQYAVRYCLPDPCIAGTCVRKCCPSDYVRARVHNRTRCIPSDKDFQIEFYDTRGQQIYQDAYTLRSGVKLTCLDSQVLIQLDPTRNPKSGQFKMLQSGNLYLPEFQAGNRIVCNYCIEDYVEGDVTVRKANICTNKNNKTAKFSDNSTDDQTSKLVRDIFSYLTIVSSLFLMATFIVYVIVPEIRNIHGVIVMSYCAALAITYICLNVIRFRTRNDIGRGACMTLAVMTHFSFLSAFTWLNIMSFDIWWTLTDFRPKRSKLEGGNHIGHRFTYYSLYAWGVPLIFVIVGQILDYLANSFKFREESLTNETCITNSSTTTFHLMHPDLGPPNCWFKDNISMLPLLYGPIGLILLSNTVFFIMTAVKLCQVTYETRIAIKKRKKRNYIVIFSIFLLMGLTWITEILTTYIKGSFFYSIPTDILNTLTGVFVFIIFVCKKEVRRRLRKKLIFVETFFRRMKLHGSSYGQEVASTRGSICHSSSESSDEREEISLSQLRGNETRIE